MLVNATALKMGARSEQCYQMTSYLLAKTMNSALNSSFTQNKQLSNQERVAQKVKNTIPVVLTYIQFLQLEFAISKTILKIAAAGTLSKGLSGLLLNFTPAVASSSVSAAVSSPVPVAVSNVVSGAVSSPVCAVASSPVSEAASSPVCLNYLRTNLVLANLGVEHTIPTMN